MLWNQDVSRGIRRWERVRAGLLVLCSVVGLVLADARAGVAAEAELPPPVAGAVDEALAAWADFASSGSVTVVEAAFVVGGPQHELLIDRAGAGVGEMAPLTLRVLESRLRYLGPQQATVWARVEVSRSGFRSETFSWDFDLVRRSGRWQVWTVVPAEPPRPDAPMAEAGVQPSATMSSSSTTSTTEPDAAAAPSEATSSVPRGTRLPALSAWIIVLTIVAVAAAGYLAPRLDRRAER